MTNSSFTIIQIRERTHIYSIILLEFAVMLIICWEILLDRLVVSREYKAQRETLMMSILFVIIDSAYVIIFFNGYDICCEDLILIRKLVYLFYSSGIKFKPCIMNILDASVYIR